MRCPYCYEKIPKYQIVCPVCGFSKDNLKTAKNKIVPQMRKKDPESIIMITDVPDDLGKRKLLLLALFGGMIGLHAYYCKRTGRGIYQSIATVILLIGTYINFGDIYIKGLTSEPSFAAVIGVIGAIAFYIWVNDLIRIILGKFKIPVVLEDRM